MAREAILRDTKPLVSRRFTCATSTGIPKGTYLTYADPYTASAATLNDIVFAGFAHADVNQSTDTGFNTETSVTADKGGIYELVASGNITAGRLVSMAHPGNYVKECTASTMASMGIVVGIALETATTGEQINVEVFA
jgi:hypothetical protein